MKTFLVHHLFPTFAVAALGGALVLGLSGCGKSESEVGAGPAVAKPKEAASQLQQAFVAAPPEVKTTVAEASQALQTANYEQAVKSMQVIRTRKDLTMEQGMAVRASEQSLEQRLISAMASGDPKAKQAYEMLKRSRRD